MTDDFNDYKLLLLRMAEDGVSNYKEVAKALADHEKESDKRIDKIEQSMAVMATKIWVGAGIISVVFTAIVTALFRHFGGMI